MLAALAILPAYAHGQILECVDAGGNIEYSQKCAAGTIKQREVVNAAETNPSGERTPPQQSYKEQDAAFRRRQLEREQAEVKARAAAEDAARKCKTAQARLLSTENARRISAGIDPKTGQTRYLDDNERVAATQKARDSVATLCRQ